jgi:CRISPR-associated protein Csh2
MTLIKENSDFLFLYEAILSNPNGDPDHENRPRMDYDTKTNLVTDVRLKRFIRDYLTDKGKEIFVNMESDAKVSMEMKMKAEINRILSNKENIELIFKDSPEFKSIFDELFPQEENLFETETPENIYDQVKKDKKLAEFLLSKLVNLFFIDVRMFGSAFAIESFKKAFTGPIQINWGYSLHPVELVKSDSIVTIMNEGESTFGKDYRLYYSLIAYNGTINKNAAKTTGLTETDRETFRDAIWNAIPANPTRSKVNQYPKLYVEIIYNDGYSNGYFGDLRNYVEVKPKIDHIRKLEDLEVSFGKLKTLLDEYKGENKPIKDVVIKSSSDINF